MDETIIFKCLESNKELGLTITDIVSLSKKPRSAVRIALAKLEGAGKVNYRKVGMAKIYNLNQNNNYDKSININKSLNFLVFILFSFIFTTVFILNPVFAANIYVSNPEMITSSNMFQRSPTIMDYNNYHWVMYTRADHIGPALRNSSYDPEADNYTIYYKYVSNINSLSDSEDIYLAISANTLANGFTQRDISSISYNSRLYLFATGSINSPDASVYYYINDFGEWGGPYLLIEGFEGENDINVPDGVGENLSVVTDEEWIYIFSSNNSGLYLTTWNTTHYGINNTFISLNTNANIYFANEYLYLTISDEQNISIYRATSSSSPEFSLYSIINSSNYQYTPNLLFFNNSFYLLTVENDGVSKHLQIRTSVDALNWTQPKFVTLGKYDVDFDGSYSAQNEIWMDYDAKLYDADGSLKIFYTSESDTTPDFSDANIFYLPFDWNTSSNHVNYLQNAVDIASNNDILILKNATYYEKIIINKNISLMGSDSFLYSTPGSTVISVRAGNISIKNITVSYGTTGIHVVYGTQINSINISYCTLSGNSLFGLNNEGNGTVFATKNYWGDIFGPDNLGEGEGDDVSEYVLFSPWFESSKKTGILYTEQVLSINELINFDSIKGDNEYLGLSDGEVKVDLNLIKKGYGETSISWFTNDSSAITNKGEVIRKNTNSKVRLTASLTLADSSRKNVSLSAITVLAKDITDVQAVNNTLTWLTFNIIKQNNLNETNISADLNLTKKGVNYTKINWTSSNQSFIDEDGNVFLTNVSKNVTVVATVSRGNVVNTKQFDFTVTGTLNQDVLDLVLAKKELTNLLILNGNLNINELMSTVYLPTELNNHPGVYINWSTTDFNIINERNKSSRLVVLDYSNFFTDEIEPTVYIDRSYSPYPAGDEGPIIGNDMEFSCSYCESAVFEGQTEIDPEGELCGYEENLFYNIIRNNEIFCAKSDVSQRKYTIDFLSMTDSGCMDNDDGFCNASQNRTSYYLSDQLGRGKVTKNATSRKEVMLTATLTKNGTNITRTYLFKSGLKEALSSYNSRGQIYVINDTSELVVNSSNIGKINSVYIPRSYAYNEKVIFNMAELRNESSNNRIIINNDLLFVREVAANTNHTLTIKENTTISGGDNWNGLLLLPTILVNEDSDIYYINNSANGVVDFVLEAGSSQSNLNFSSPVKIVISKRGGKYVAMTDGGYQLNRITTICNDLTNPTNIEEGKECLFDDGTDITIWTYHLTKFATYYNDVDDEDDDSAPNTASFPGGSNRETPTEPVAIKLCEENWTCSSWSECSLKDKMTRTCVDENSCGTAKKTPSTSMNCVRLEEPSKEVMEYTEEERALFDVIIDIITPLINYKKVLLAKITLINFGSKSKVSVNLKYTLYDEEGLIVNMYDKQVDVDTQKQFIDSFDVSELTKGKYKLIVNLRYPGQTEPAVAEKEFRIREYDLNLINSLILISGLMFILLIDKYHFKKIFK